MTENRIIKARDLEDSGSNVEKVNLGLRKFHDKVFKHMPLDEQPVAMEDEVPPLEFDEDGEPILDGGGEDHQVKIERFYGDEGELQGLKITCRCGEVIDLEFTREEDEALPGSDEPDLEETPAEAVEKLDQSLYEPLPEDGQTSETQEFQPLDQPAEPVPEAGPAVEEAVPEETEISMDNGEENIEIEET